MQKRGSSLKNKVKDSSPNIIIAEEEQNLRILLSMSDDGVDNLINSPKTTKSDLYQPH